jgi:hypothetical protein
MRSIFKSYNLIPILSAVENVGLPLLVAGSKLKKARRLTLLALELVGLSYPRRASARPRSAAGSSSGSTALFGVSLGVALGADPLMDHAGPRPFGGFAGWWTLLPFSGPTPIAPAGGCGLSNAGLNWR